MFIEFFASFSDVRLGERIAPCYYKVPGFRISVTDVVFGVDNIKTMGICAIIKTYVVPMKEERHGVEFSR